MPAKLCVRPIAVVVLFILSTAMSSAQEIQSTSPEIELGPVTNYGSEAAAIKACRPGAAVWADRKTGYYYPKFREEYGKSPRGVFTCLKEAMAADYWGFGTIDSLGGRAGRSFPDKFPCSVCA